MRRERISTLQTIVGREHVLHHTEACSVYECDGYTLEKSVPEVVVLPGSVNELREVMAALHLWGTAVVPRGAGTSLAGGCLSARGEVVVSLSRLRTIEQFDAVNRLALVQAGVVNAALSRAGGPHQLFYAPDPSSQQACTLGGNIATNSGGPHTLKYGVTVNHVLAVELLRPDGTTTWIGSPVPGRGGPDVTALVVGHEGTFGLVTRAWVKLTPAVPGVRTVLASFTTIDSAAQAVSALLRSGVLPAAVEMMDRPILRALEDAYGLSFSENAEAVLLIEVDGPEAGCDADAADVTKACKTSEAFEVHQASDEVERETLWTARKRAFGALGRLARNYCTQDGVVPRSRLPQTLSAISAIGRRHGIEVANVFHAGDGNLHPILLYDERDASQVDHVVKASHEILEECLRQGGSLTGEHGIGVEKLALMEAAFSPETLELMRRLRAVFDPDSRCNPGKMIPSGSGCIDPVAWGPGRQAAL